MGRLGDVGRPVLIKRPARGHPAAETMTRPIPIPVSPCRSSTATFTDQEKDGEGGRSQPQGHDAAREGAAAAERSRGPSLRAERDHPGVCVGRLHRRTSFR